MVLLRSLVTLAALLAGATTTTIFAQDIDRCTMSTDNKCPVEKLQLLPGGNGSALIYPGGQTRCIFDDFEGGKTGGLNAKKEYFFQVFPEPKSKDKVLFFFKGGGACIDDATCSFASACTLGDNMNLFDTVAMPANNSGIFDKTRAENPFKDWNIVHVSYCTADLHMGNKVRDLPVPSNVSLLSSVSEVCKVKMSTHQVGYINTMAVLDWAIANYPSPKQLVIGGLSAGSLATQAYAKLITEKWQAKQKGIEVSILPDSFVGVVVTPGDAVKLIQYYGGCENDMSFSPEIVAGCKNGTLTLPELVSSNIKATSDYKWLFLNSKGDKTQRLYYQLLKEGLNGFPFLNAPSADFLYQGMQDILNGYKKISSLVRTVFVDGETHGFLARFLFYNTLDDSGVSLPTLISDWLKGSNGSPSTLPATSPSAPSSTSASSSPSISPSTAPGTPSSATAVPATGKPSTNPSTPDRSAC